MRSALRLFATRSARACRGMARQLAGAAAALGSAAIGRAWNRSLPSDALGGYGDAAVRATLALRRARGRAARARAPGALASCPCEGGPRIARWIGAAQRSDESASRLQLLEIRGDDRPRRGWRTIAAASSIGADLTGARRVPRKSR